MSCMTCHDAHRDDQGPASFLRGEMLELPFREARPEQKPAAASRGGDRIAAKKPVVCPVNPTSEVSRVPHAEGADARCCTGT